MHSTVAGLLMKPHPTPNYTKGKIPKALREQVWLVHNGPVFETKCNVTWCMNKINVFDYQCGHNIPESKGGQTNIGNLLPICGRCNISMGNHYSIDEWNKRFAPKVVEAVQIEKAGCLLLSLERFRYRKS
jgi:5-methylcytosine-specific restriction endonuclease McrA